MRYIARVIMDSAEQFSQLNESIFQEQNVYETKCDTRVIEIPLDKELSESESDEFAVALSNHLFESGVSDFDIEITTDQDDQYVFEETYHGDDFFENYGVIGYTEPLQEAEYRGRKVTLNKPTRGDVKKFKVYVKDPKTGNVKKVNFGDPNMRIKKSNPARRRSFRARHNCDNPGPKTKARYWSCKAW